MRQPSEIVFIAGEMVPYCKTGGLADVLGALPSALTKLGSKVTVFIPLYRHVTLWTERTGKELPIVVDRLPFFLPGYTGQASVREFVEPSGVRVLFIDLPSAYDRDQLYTEDGHDYSDNLSRFSVFSKAALEACKALDIKPDILHAHDWQGSMALVYMKSHYAADEFFKNTKTVLTIHNLGYQGRFPSDKFQAVDLPWDYFTTETLEYFGQVNVLKGGIIFTDHITTVSPTYSKEIQTTEHGAGLDGVLTSKADILTGILNGVDYSVWDPRNDPHIDASFSSDDLSGKWKCRTALRKEMGLPEGKGPLIGMISRLAEQKGFELLLEALPKLVKLDCQLVVLGTGDQRYHDELSKAAEKYPKNVAVRLAFANPLAHQIEAGSDIFCMPSRYEPCGLNQLYSLRYGTVPLVTSTGGLKDTVVNATQVQLKKGKATGFVMKAFSSGSLVNTVKKAVELFRNDPKGWKKLMITGMNADFGWPAQAKIYRKLYLKILQ